MVPLLTTKQYLEKQSSTTTKLSTLLICCDLILQHLGKSGHIVYYNISADPSTVMINEQITAALWEELIQPMQEPCRSAAEVLLCHYAFPKCEWRERIAIAKPLCRWVSYSSLGISFAY